MLSRLIRGLFKKNKGSKDYSLASKPSSYYLEQFSEGGIEITPYSPAGIYRRENNEWIKVEKGGIHFSESPEQGIHTIQADGYEFDVCFESTSTHIDPGLFGVAKDVLGSIAEMDSAARATPSSTNYEEQLTYVNISAEEVKLHYCSTTINTEWDAYFKKDETGKWVFEGLG